jgi:(aminoalkyl)phosphonate N-acetyltransferase
MPMKINLRKALSTDIDQVYDLVCQLEGCKMNRDRFLEIYTHNLTDERIHYWVIKHEKKVIGFVSLHMQDLLHHTDKVAEVQELCVAENHRGKGFGKLLLDQVILEAKNQNCELIELSANKKRIDAHRFYEREGWERSHYKFTMKLN